MTVFWVFVGSIILFLLGYELYGRFLEKKFDINSDIKMPSKTKEDGVDFVPTKALVLFGHHFSSIAGAGPIVGPITAALLFGWLPAVLWCVIGCIFIGAMHDFAALVISAKNGGESISSICQKYFSPASYKMYVWFCWLSLVYLIIVFCDLTASTFAPDVSNLTEPLKNTALQTASGVAYASFFYIILAVLFGILTRTKKISFIVATCIFVPLVFATIFLTQYLPVMGILSMDNPKLIFSLILLAYCFIASILPVWFLLQPRDYLSSYLLFVCIILSFIGIIVAGPMSEIDVHFPAWTGWFAKGQGGLFPILFITIACGAVSGFHSLVSGGTSSKQVEKPEDMRRIGYGAMIVEGILAIISVCAIMIVSKGSCKGLTPNEIFANGFGNFVNAIGIPAMYGKAFALLAISTFLLTTLDTCTRLARYIFEEMFNKKSILLNFIYTFLVLLIPVLMVFTKIQDPENANLTIPVWKAIWPVFGASQQLLAGLCLMVVYIIRKHQGKSTGFVIIPMIFMIAASIWGVIRIMLNYIHSNNYSIIAFSAVLLVLAVYICADVFGFGRKHWVKK